MGKKNILVTGGSGFIGSNLVDLLIEQGNSVIVIDDYSTGMKDNNNFSAVYHDEDLCSYIDKIDELVEKLKNYHIEVVYHLAASADVFLSINNPERVFEINVLASITLVRACQKVGVSQFVFASTSAVYGEPIYLPVDVSHSTNPISPYGLSKLSFEQYLNYFSSHTDMKISIFRLPNVYGPRQRSDLEGGVVAIFDELMKNDLPVNIYGDGRQTRDWVYVTDIVYAFQSVLQFKEKYKVFLLGSNTETSLIDLFEFLSDVRCYERKPNFIKARPGDIKNMVMDFDEAKSLLEWEPRISLNDGIIKLVKRV